MVEAYYGVAFLLSVLLMLFYVYEYHRHYDVHITLAFVFAVINNLAQLLVCESKTVAEALVANKILYISGCYLILMITLVIFSLCDIHLNKPIKLSFYLFTTIVFFFTLQMGRNDLYYKNVSLVQENGVSVLVKEYGVLHPFYYAMLVIYFIIGAGAIGYTFFKKSQVSNHFVILLSIPEILSFVGFFAGRKLCQAVPSIPDVEVTPLIYDVSLVVYLVITHIIIRYNISETVIDSVVQRGDRGFLSFDFKFRYLGSNEMAKEIFPELRELAVDKPITNEHLKNSLLKWLEDFRQDNSRNKVYYQAGEHTYLVNVDYLSDGGHTCGYHIYLRDDTQNQKYIALLDSFNTELQAEVAQKTEHIVEMHDNLILSMAMMVESRDNSTGGHIRRTSEGIRILVDEIRRSGEFELSEQFCRNIIKAAPMHDLGKITVDDAVLRKPGRYTDEDYAIMKTHAAEGARIVHEILKCTDDEGFRVIAENVAHYHHERWDGRGYPDGLAGEQIPLEARIMSIADVYDALVSKRVYKDKMSFEKADSIIMEGMGTQFDPHLEACYIAARPRLEEYYSNIDAG